jgi:hypothetical protein
MKKPPVILPAVPVPAILAVIVLKNSLNLQKKKKLKNDKFEYNFKYRKVKKINQKGCKMLFCPKLGYIELNLSKNTVLSFFHLKPAFLLK